MLNLRPHNRFHVPNGLAMLAAVLLLVSSVAGFYPGSEASSSSLNSSPSVKVESSDSIDIDEKVANKRRGLSLGSLLFRRG